MSWFEYELDKRKIQSGYGVDFGHRYNKIPKVGGAEVVDSIVESTNKMYGIKDKFIEKLRSTAGEMKQAEEAALNFGTAVSLPYFTSYDLEYVLIKSNLNDIYLVKSLYEDLMNYWGKEPKEIKTVELYGGSKSGEDIADVEEKNRDYLICLEDLYNEIIYNE